MAVRMPRVLDANLGEAFRLRPVEMSITFNLRDDDTATITLPDDAPDVPVRTFLELYTPKGSAGIFRVTSMSRDIFNQRVLTLKWAVCTLEDSVYKAQLDYDGTVSGFLTDVLAQQTVARWQLGTVERTADFKHTGINYTQLSELIRVMMEDDPGYYFEADYSTTPWTLNYKAVPSSVGCEFRLTRNTETVQIVRNDAELCTRLYLSVSTEETESGVTETVTELKTYNDTAAQAVYGIVEKTASIATEDVADVDGWAAQFLAEHSTPSVQIAISAFELARLTGDTWDELSQGKLARVSLAGEPLEERVITVTYPDLLGEPDLVQVQLANKASTATGAIADLARNVRKLGGGGGGGGGGYASAAELRNVATLVSGNTTDITKLFTKTEINSLAANETLYGKITSNRDDINTNSGDITNLVNKTAIGRLATGETLYGKIEGNTTDITSINGKVGSVPDGSDLYSLHVSNSDKIGSVPSGSNLYNMYTTVSSTVSGNTSDISNLTSKTGIGSLTGTETLYSRTATNASNLSDVSGKVGSVPSGSNLYSLHQTNANNISDISSRVTTLETNTADISKSGSDTVIQHLSVPQSFDFDGKSVSWQSKSVLTSLTITMPSITLSASHPFVYLNGSTWDDLAAVAGSKVITAYTAGSVTGPGSTTIYYLGRVPN